jgi:hypothetical protein
MSAMPSAKRRSGTAPHRTPSIATAAEYWEGHHGSRSDEEWALIQVNASMTDHLARDVVLSPEALLWSQCGHERGVRAQDFTALHSK